MHRIAQNDDLNMAAGRHLQQELAFADTIYTHYEPNTQRSLSMSL